MKRFKDFVNENKDDKNSFPTFLEDVKKAYKKDFKYTESQADEFISLYARLLKDAWSNGFTVREAIASTKIPGYRVSNDKVDESYVFEIDSDYENSYKMLEDINRKEQLINGEGIVDNYYQKYNKKNFSDVRIFERLKNNYKSLIKVYEEKRKQLNDK